MKKEYFEFTEKEVEIIKGYRQLTFLAKKNIEEAIRIYPKIDKKINTRSLTLVIDNK